MDVCWFEEGTEGLLPYRGRADDMMYWWEAPKLGKLGSKVPSPGLGGPGRVWTLLGLVIEKDGTRSTACVGALGRVSQKLQGGQHIFQATENAKREAKTCTRETRTVRMGKVREIDHPGLWAYPLPPVPEVEPNL
jgi:hypothetical protein